MEIFVSSASRPGRARHFALALTSVVTLGLALSGCSGDAEPETTTMPTGNIVQGGAPGQPNTTLTELPEVPDFVTENDITFVRSMLVHHAQALEMTEMVPERTSREDVPLFAERIELSQEDEIRLMENWLKERGEPIFDPRQGSGHGHSDVEMGGMLTDAQIERLRAADGEEFDEMFLQYMYYHHTGAVQMVEDLWNAEGAQDTFIFQLAKEIDGDQRIEMDRIVEMLADMDQVPTTPES